MIKTQKEMIAVLDTLGQEKIPDLIRETHVIAMVMGVYLTPVKSSIGEMFSSMAFHCARLIQEINPQLIKTDEELAKALLQELQKIQAEQEQKEKEKSGK